MRRIIGLLGQYRRERGPLVLAYHRIGEPALDPWNLSVKPQNFARHMHEVCRRANPVGLEELMGSLLAGRLRRNSIAVTFDDGYADNLDVAVPVLGRYSVPATVFVTTGSLGKSKEFWWDELERILLKTKRPLHSFLPKGSPGRIGASILRVYLELWEEMRQLGQAARRLRLEDIRARASVTAEPRPSYLPVSEEELERLSKSVEIGAHTVTHPALAELPRCEQQKEIVEGKERLEQLIGRRVRVISYPHGSYSRETAEIVRESGFDYACALNGTPVPVGCDPFLIPRVMVSDWPGYRFGIWLSRWLGQ